MKHKLGICIPYRNREEHLKKLVPSLSAHLDKCGIDHKFYVGHQVDDKLFNRGAMKNIAAQFAFNDGCDYVAWHDVDMLPYDEGCDYSYPGETPVHIATALSKYNYGLGYDQYFGGVVLFTKEQVEKTNGYSNEYWDWGQEDDDLFWRCYYEGYTTGKVFRKYENKPYIEFNGKKSAVILPVNKAISGCLSKDHTISILFYAEQQPDKAPVWLVGADDKKFMEYPIFRKNNACTYGISFNNSRAVTALLFDRDENQYYTYAKRFENMWTWVSLSYSKEENNLHLYINDELVRNMNGVKESLPFPIEGMLRRHDSFGSIILGHCPCMNAYLKGKIAEIKIFNKFHNPQEITKAIDGTEGAVLHCDFDVETHGLIDNVTNTDGSAFDVEIGTENIDVIENVLPFRREGKFVCLPHPDEGFVNGKWVKGETTAKNERRLITMMQQNKIDYKNDGMNSLNYMLISTTNILSDKCLIINVKL